MDISETRKMIRSQGDKVVILEEGKPAIVIMSYEACMDLDLPQQSVSGQKIQPEVAKPGADESDVRLTLKALPFL